jgi:hypothetical protein
MADESDHKRALHARMTYKLPGRELAAFANNFTDRTIVVTRVDFTTVIGAGVNSLDRPRRFGGFG